MKMHGMMRRMAFFLLALALLAAAPASAAGVGGKAKTKNKQGGAGARTTKGALAFHYQDAEDEDLQVLADVLKEEAVFSVAAQMAEQIRLPRDIDVIFAECGVDNAFYDSETYQITMCYELFAGLGTAFASEDSSDEEVGNAVLGASFFIFLHEFGHALVHNLDLPVTGKEEDAVDDLATLILINAGKDGEVAALHGLLHFASLAEQYESGSAEELAFWDEHSLSAQRVFSVACLLYGADPEGYAELVGDDGLPEARAQNCPAEYAQKSRAWDKLLAPYTY